MQNALNSLCDNSHDIDNTLADIRNVKIDTSLPLTERLQSYIQQIRNPYRYKCGEIKVRVSFADTDVSLEDRIKQLLMAPCTT
jgi:hypothetical protein